MISYAFQIYALFIANSREIKQNYRVLFESIVSNTGNWEKEMKYLVPSLATFMIAVIFRYPEFAAQYTN